MKQNRKNGFNRLLSLVLSCLMVLSTVTLAFAEDSEEHDHEVVVVGPDGSVSEVVVPDEDVIPDELSVAVINSDGSVSTVSSEDYGEDLLLIASNVSSGAGVAEHWFYKQLTAQGQKIYDALLAMFVVGDMEDGETDLDLSENDIVSQAAIEGYLNGERALFNDFAAAKDAFDLEHPEAWYVDSSMLTFRVAQEPNGRYHAYIGPGRTDNYYVSGVSSVSDVQKKSVALESMIDSIVKGAQAGDYKTDAERVRYVHDRITHSISYRFETDCEPANVGFIRTSYALVTHEGVCEGYARSFQYAMNQLGIPCVLIHGVQTSGTPEDHMWAAVYLEKPDSEESSGIMTMSAGTFGWYVVDATWDDPVGLDKNGNIKRGGENGNDGGEVETYLMVGQDVVGQNWQPSGYVSTGAMEFKYPDIAQISYRTSVLEMNGLKITYDEDLMEDQKSMVYRVSFNGDGLKAAADKGYYFLNRMWDINADGSVDGFDWYYPAHMLHAMGDHFDPDDNFQNNGNKYYHDTDEYLVMNVLNCEYVEFAITTKAPPNWQSADDLLTMDGYYAGDGSDILAETGLIYNKYGTYEQPPYVKNMAPGMNEDLAPGYNYTMHVEFTDILYRPDQESVDIAPEGKLNDAETAMNQDVEILYDTSTYSWGMNGNKPHTLAEAHYPENIRFLCETHEIHTDTSELGSDCRLTGLEYEFKASSLWHDDSVRYEFYVTGLVGVKSNKLANKWSYIFENRYPFCTCPLASGYWWSLWGQPSLLDNPDNLDLSKMVTEGVDGKQSSLEALREQMHLDPFDMNGRIMLTVSNTGENRGKSEEIANALEEQGNVPADSIVSSMLYEIDFARICRETIVETGQSVRLCVGFPDGVDARALEGLVFKAYHFTRDIEGTCPTPDDPQHVHTGLVISVEEIPIEVTAYGLVIGCKSFSPFEIVALDADKVDEPVDNSKTVIVASDMGGKILRSDGKVAAGEDGNIKLQPNESITLKVVPDEGKAIDFLGFDGHEIVAADDGTITFAYEDMVGSAVLVTATFMDETVVVRDEDAGMTRVVADVSTELSSEAPIHLTADKKLWVGANAESEHEGYGFSTIQAAIDYIAEEEGNEANWTIEVDAGMYDRFVILPEMTGMMIHGKNGAVINVMNGSGSTIGGHDLYGDGLLKNSADGGGVIVLSGGVIFDGLTFQMGSVTGSGLGFSYTSAIQVANGNMYPETCANLDNVIVRNCVFNGSGVGSGVYLGSKVDTYLIANNQFNNMDMAVSQIDVAGAPKNISLTGNQVSGCDHFYYNYFTAQDSDVGRDWNGSLVIDKNTITGTADRACATAVYDMSATKELANMSISGNTITYGDFIQFGLDAHEGANRVFDKNTVNGYSIYVGMDDSASNPGRYDVLMEAAGIGDGHWELAPDAASHDVSGKIILPEGETDMASYVQKLIDVANAIPSSTLGILNLGIREDGTRSSNNEAFSAVRELGAWVHDNILWVAGLVTPESVPPVACEHEARTAYGEAKQAACIADGLEPGEWCPTCETVFEQPKVIPATGHVNLKDIGIAADADCENTGLIPGQQCEDCGEIIKEAVITDALGHDYDDDTGVCSRCQETRAENCSHNSLQEYEREEPSCTDAGYTAGTWCDDCKTWLQPREVLEAKGHVSTAVRDAKEATCGEAGSTGVEYCVDCGTTIREASEILPTGEHNFQGGTCVTCGAPDPNGSGAPVERCEGDNHVGVPVSKNDGKAATCGEAGYTDTWVCSNCGDVLVEQKTIDPTGRHNFVAGVCTVCLTVDESYTPPVTSKDCTATEHYGTAVSRNDGVLPTCVSDGWSSSMYCDKCNQTIIERQVLQATGIHDFVDGYCSVCQTPDPSKPTEPPVDDDKCSGDKHIGPVVGENNAVEPTCGTTGLTESTRCEACGKIVTEQEEIPATGKHEFEDGKCKNCGAPEKCSGDEHVGPVVGDGNAIAPTCSTPGKTESTHCEACGKPVAEQVEIPATNQHEYEKGVCKNCGAKAPEKCSDGKHLGPVVSDNNAIAATCVKPGLTASMRCTACGEIVRGQTTIPATGRHEFYRGLCINCGRPEYYYGPSNTYRYSITIDSKIANGRVKSNVSRVTEGSTVRLTVIPDDGYEMSELLVTYGLRDRELTLKDRGDGVWSFVMPAYDVKVTATFVEIDSENLGDGDTENPTKPDPESGHVDGYCPSAGLVDVPSDAWYHEAVDFVVSHGTVDGVAENRFAPDDIITRAQFVTMLYRIEGSPATAKSIPFADCMPGSWYSYAVIWAQVNGIVYGYDENTFGPNDDLTREQLAAILERYTNYRGMVTSRTLSDLGRYPDSNMISGWAVENVAWAVSNRVIQGDDNGFLNPRGNGTRAEVAQMLYNYCRAFNIE